MKQGSGLSASTNWKAVLAIGGAILFNAAGSSSVLLGADQTAVTSSAKDTLSFWLIVGLAAIIVFMSIRNWFSRRLVNTCAETLDTPETVEESGGVPFAESLDILDGLRFKKDSPLYEQASQQSQRQVQRYLDELKKTTGYNSGVYGYAPTQELLQSVANRVDSSFVDSICDSRSYWMKLIYKDQPVPSGLSRYIRQLYRPIQAPVGAVVRLQAPAFSVALLAGLGAIAGAWLLGIFAWTSGIKEPSDITTLLGATLGAAGLAGLLFRVTEDETWRRRIEMAIGGVAVADIAGSLFLKYMSWNYFFGKENAQMGSIFKRVFIYVFLFLLIRLLKREVSFDAADYGIKLNGLYFRQIESAVTTIALCVKNQEIFDQKWADRESAWVEQEGKLHDEIVQLKEQLKGNRLSGVYIAKMDTDINRLWTQDIRQLEPLLIGLSQKFCANGFSVPSGRMKFAQQLDALLLPQSGQNEPIPSVEAEPINTTIWTAEMETMYNAIGLIDPGDEVEILDEPIIQNDKVVSLGNVKKRTT